MCRSAITTLSTRTLSVRKRRRPGRRAMLASSILPGRNRRPRRRGVRHLLWRRTCRRSRTRRGSREPAPEGIARQTENQESADRLVQQTDSQQTGRHLGRSREPATAWMRSRHLTTAWSRHLRSRLLTECADTNGNEDLDLVRGTLCGRPCLPEVGGRRPATNLGGGGLVAGGRLS